MVEAITEPYGILTPWIMTQLTAAYTIETRRNLDAQQGKKTYRTICMFHLDPAPACFLHQGSGTTGRRSPGRVMALPSDTAIIPAHCHLSSRAGVSYRRLARTPTSESRRFRYGAVRWDSVATVTNPLRGAVRCKNYNCRPYIMP